MHIQAMRKFEWDPSNIAWVKKYINLFSGEKKNVIFEAIKQHVKFVKKNKNNLKHSVTHGDPNDYNIVVKNQKIVGLIDFGDSIYAPSINDLAISLSYALTQSQNLFATLQNIIGSYNKIYSINDDEIYSLFGLIKSRLVITLVMAAKQRKNILIIIISVSVKKMHGL